MAFLSLILHYNLLYHIIIVIVPRFFSGTARRSPTNATMEIG